MGYEFSYDKEMLRKDPDAMLDLIERLYQEINRLKAQLAKYTSPLFIIRKFIAHVTKLTQL